MGNMIGTSNHTLKPTTNQMRSRTVAVCHYRGIGEDLEILYFTYLETPS